MPLMVLPVSQGLATSAAFGALVVSAALLVLGSAAVIPLEMPIVATSGGNRLVTTHYRFCNSMLGISPLIGNSATRVIFGVVLRWNRTAILLDSSVFCGRCCGICAQSPSSDQRSSNRHRLNRNRACLAAEEVNTEERK
ncbi:MULTISPECIES: hypothetical protein [Mycobacterium]|uniref:hypothetical protein n=1 Tax=Mycobacterium TaxID=1763 RepID=UPI001CCD3134|nr:MULTISPECIES: hypothetical protein [Mycobacterium]MDM4140944.1 hypothetical protein [Mycobacterium sp. FLAC0960]WSE53561.1 hypothetical protein QGN31_11305 [Mycobacterium sp. 2-64]